MTDRYQVSFLVDVEVTMMIDAESAEDAAEIANDEIEVEWQDGALMGWKLDIVERIEATDGDRQ